MVRVRVRGRGRGRGRGGGRVVTSVLTVSAFITAGPTATTASWIPPAVFSASQACSRMCTWLG